MKPCPLTYDKSPVDTWPVRSAWPRGTPAAKSGFLRGSAAGRTGETVTDEEVGLFTSGATAHNTLYQQLRRLFVLQTNHKKNTDTTRATPNTASMLDSNC